MKMPRFIANAAFCCAVALSLTEVPAREVSGVAILPAVRVAGGDLRLNGVGVRKEKVLFKAYVIALYLEEFTTNAKVAIQTDETKRIVIIMLREVGRERFIQAMEEGIMRKLPACDANPPCPARPP